MMKHIDCFYSCWTLLLVAKNEVNPFMKVSWDVITLQRLQPRWNTIQMSTQCHWETPLAILGLFLTSLWTLINSRGSPFAQGGRMTSASLVPFCLAPERPRQKLILWTLKNEKVSQFWPLPVSPYTDPGQSCWSWAGTQAGRRTLVLALWRQPCCVWRQRTRLHVHCGTSCLPDQNDLPGIHTSTQKNGLGLKLHTFIVSQLNKYFNKHKM